MLREREQAGFTLLEVMVAFFIAALATVMVLQASFTGAAQSRVASRTQEAVARAQSRLASLGVLTMLQREDLSGDDGGGFAWHLSVAPLQSTGGLTLYGIRLTETFGNRQVTLITKRLVPSR